LTIVGDQLSNSSLGRSNFFTVTPDQLPTHWLEPVRVLSNVVLPQLGLPDKVILMSINLTGYHKPQYRQILGHLVLAGDFGP